MSDDYEHALGGLRGHIVYGEQTAGDTPVEWMQVKVALPYLRGAERALIAERQRADAAEAEVARLRAIVAGRTTPPTDAELAAVDAADGAWIVARVTGPGTSGGVLCQSIDSARRLRRWGTPLWWIALDAHRRPCAWPVTP